MGIANDTASHIDAGPHSVDTERCAVGYNVATAVLEIRGNISTSRNGASSGNVRIGGSLFAVGQIDGGLAVSIGDGHNDGDVVHNIDADHV